MIHVFLCVDEIPEPIAHGITLNVLDHTYSLMSEWEALIGEITVGKSFDELLALARHSNAQWGVFMKAGNIVEHRLFQHLLNDTTPDTVLVGHILDRKERHYELHDQMFMINLAKLKELPPLRYAATPGWKPRIARSQENYHDDYTPKWVKHSGGSEYVENPAPGSDLIAALADHGKMRPFSPAERGQKHYLYLEHGLDRFAGNIERHIMDSDGYYLFNSDIITVDQFKLVYDKPNISRFFTPASGMNPFLMMAQRSLTEDFRMVVFDRSPVALAAYRYILYEWDGDHIRSVLHRIQPSRVIARYDWEQHWEQYLDWFGGKAQWLSFFNYVRSRPNEVKYFDVAEQWRDPWFVSHMDNDAVYWLTNIYRYTPTAMFRSFEYRRRRLIEHLEFLKTKMPEAYVQGIFTNWDYLGRIADVDVNALGNPPRPWREPGWF